MPGTPPPSPTRTLSAPGSPRSLSPGSKSRAANAAALAARRAKADTRKATNFEGPAPNRRRFPPKKKDKENLRRYTLKKMHKAALKAQGAAVRSKPRPESARPSRSASKSPAAAAAPAPNGKKTVHQVAKMSDKEFATYVDGLSESGREDLVKMVIAYRPIQDRTFHEMVIMKAKKPAAFKFMMRFISPEDEEVFETLEKRFELAE